MKILCSLLRSKLLPNPSCKFNFQLLRLIVAWSKVKKSKIILFKMGACVTIKIDVHINANDVLKNIYRYKKTKRCDGNKIIQFLSAKNVDCIKEFILLWQIPLISLIQLKNKQFYKFFIVWYSVYISAHPFPKHFFIIQIYRVGQKYNLNFN